MTEEDGLWKLEQRRLIKVGNSLAVTIHKDEREKLGICKGDELTVKVFDNGKIVMEPSANSD